MIVAANGNKLIQDTKTVEARMVALACGEFGEVEAAVLEVAGAQIKYINTRFARLQCKSDVSRALILRNQIINRCISVSLLPSPGIFTANQQQ